MDNSVSYNNTLNDEDIFLIPYRKRDKWGYCDKDKNIIIPTIYDECYTFLDDLAVVGVLNEKKEMHYGYINRNGELITELIYDYTAQFSEGLAGVEIKGKSGYIDKKGRLAIPMEYESWFAFDCKPSNFHDGLARVKKKGKVGFIDKENNIVVPLIYRGASIFREGLAAVRWMDESKFPYRAFDFIDKNWNTVIKNVYPYIDQGPYDFDRDLHIFHEGLVPIVNKKGLSGYINKHGKQVTPFIYHVVGDFSGGMAPAGLRWLGKLGFIDYEGSWVVPPKYDWVRKFSEGLAAVKIGEKWGYINKEGDEVIPPVYDEAFEFSEELTSVKVDGKFGFINKEGKVVIPPLYQSVTLFSDGVSRVENPEMGFIDRNNTQYWED